MQVILSRKGFDSATGGQPSPILPDGTLLSLPIPASDSTQKFTDISFKGESYYDIIRQLKENTKIKEKWNCHLDPDLRKSCLQRKRNWRPLFGQADLSQNHLENNGVKAGDLFLFFGWFKETEKVHGKLQYKKNADDLHIIFGYLQIGAIFNNNNFPEQVKYHPHAIREFKTNNNCIYEAGDVLSFARSYPGGGCFKYNENLVLTKSGYSRSKWNLPDFFRDIKISYHKPESFKSNYFQSVGRGQEFVIEENVFVSGWAKEKIKYYTES